MILFHPKLKFELEKQIVDKNGRYLFWTARLQTVKLFLLIFMHQTM